MNNFIKLDELYDAQARRSKEKEKLYDGFLTACTNKIKKCAGVYKEYTCFYEVPPFKVGYPQYDVLDLKKYIVKKLSLNGFHVREDRGLVLYISWKPEDFNYELYNKYLNYLKEKQNMKLQKRIIEPSGSSKKKNEEKTVGLLTYGNNDAVPVNLKEFEKHSIEKRVFKKH